jgi:aspartate dehydrogenase
MRLSTLGLIGAGAIATTLLETLASELPQPLDRLTVLASSPDSALKAEASLGDAGRKAAKAFAVTFDRTAFLSEKPGLVVECASHQAVIAHGPAVLEAGLPLLIVSTGAMADETLHQRLLQLAAAHDTQIILSPGAMGGIDILSAGRLSGLTSVTYTGRKPPLAWKGTPAETLLDLASVTTEAVFFEGTAREAATLYPKNANVAATLALAGLGFEKTRVKLIADPEAGGNRHEVTLHSACADVTLVILGKASPLNPKTSLTTAYALAREIINRASAQAI